ncbi:MAG: hypothetical protein LBK73_15110 [Treponema sp.]|nr:hypothetical protein [Treponema sp.]
MKGTRSGNGRRGVAQKLPPVTLGKQASGIRREISRNGTGGVYAGGESQSLSVWRRLEAKPQTR